MDQDKLIKIRNNLHQLVTHTICTSPFLEFFVENNVFDLSDIDSIRATREETEQASEFYRIIQTRVNSYPVLIEGLHATDQSDIVTILEEGIIPAGLNERSRVRKLLYEGPEASSQLPIPRANVSFNISSPVELFTGRTGELERLHQLVQRSRDMAHPTIFSKVTSISGLGGIGKTQLARQYVKKHGRDFDGNCIWLQAGTALSLIESFRTVAKDKLGITTKDANRTEKDISSVVEEVYKYFERNRSLFIFDNAEKTPWLLKFLPKNEKSIIGIILTSTSTEWDQGIQVIELHELPELDAVAMVKKGLELLEEDDSQNEIILQLVRTLQCFPLALQQAISYIQVEQGKGDYPVEVYLDDLYRRQQELLSFGEEDGLNYFELFKDYDWTTFTTWKMTIDKIGEDKINGEMALRILYAMGYLSPDAIKRDLFLRLPSVNVNNSDRVKFGVRLLVKFSMVRAEDKQRVVSIHRIVQKVIRMELSRLDKSTNALEDASQIIVKRSEDPIKEHWQHTAAVSSHLVKSRHTSNNRLGSALERIVKFIEFCRERKTGNQGEKLLYRLYKLAEKHIGSILANVLPGMLRVFETGGAGVHRQSDKISSAIMGGNGDGILDEYVRLFENLTDDKHQPFHGLFREMFTGVSDSPLGWANHPLIQPIQGRAEESLQFGRGFLTNNLESVIRGRDRSLDPLYQLLLTYYDSEAYKESFVLFWSLFPNVESITEDTFSVFTTHLTLVLEDFGRNAETAELVAEVYSLLENVTDLDLDLELDLDLD